jgi:spore maturation protein CgeB
MRIAFFGSSLLSAYWNGAATYYRGIVKALAGRGHQVTFYEPDAFGRQQHRDIEPPDWCRVVVYQPTEAEVSRCLQQASSADLMIKASGVGVLDELLEEAVPALARGLKVFWDVDAPATLERLYGDPADPFHRQVAQYDLVLTYGGGDPVVARYEAVGARRCVPIYNALDPDTHHPVPSRPELAGRLAFLGNRLPDREARVQEFFFDAAAAIDGTCLLAGSGWEDHPGGANVRYLGHLGTADHNAFNTSPLAVLNICRDSMASNGYSPATRVFEAAGAGACLISDEWLGLEMFLEPGSEVLVARDGAEVAEHVARLNEDEARRLGQAARRRMLAEHTYAHRVGVLESVLAGHRPVGAGS